MDFQPPDSADLANVYSLNRAFLDLLASAAGHEDDGERGSAAYSRVICELDQRHRLRLAETPFLLFSLAEDDLARWRPVFDSNYEFDLFDTPDRPAVSESRIVQAALGFLWQLAKKRPYSARVVSGATYFWCERLSLCTLVDLFDFASTEPHLLRMRLAENAAFWRKLLTGGTSDDASVRSAAKLSALQSVLTTIDDTSRERLPAAACSMPAPSTRVAERAAVSRNTARGYNTPPDESTVHKKPD